MRCLAQRTRTAFTLIEILISIGVVLILVSLLFAMVSKAREGAAKAACLHNLRSSAAVVLLYAAEEGNYPRACDASGSTPWCLQPDLVRYSGGSANLARTGICPLNRGAKGGWVPVNNIKGVTGYPYAVNYNVMAPQPPRISVKAVAVDSPSKRILMMDGKAGAEYGFGVFSKAAGDGFGRVNAAHSKKVNTAWCDGHVTSEDRNAINNEMLGFGQN